jgi:hypothetical protein
VRNSNGARYKSGAPITPDSISVGINKGSGKSNIQRRDRAANGSVNNDITIAEISAVVTPKVVENSLSKAKSKGRDSDTMVIDTSIHEHSMETDINTHIRILITGVVFEADKLKKISSFGCEIVTSADMSPTHLVADKVRRTDKFLCAYGKVLFILSPGWIERSVKAGKLLLEKDFLLTDGDAESKWKFSLANRVTGINLFEGYRIYCTKNIQPPNSVLESIIRSYGGTMCKRCPAFSDDVLIISHETDKSEWISLNDHKFTIYSSELILSGVLQQLIDLSSHVLLESPAKLESPKFISRDTKVAPVVDLNQDLNKPARKKRRV